MRRRWIVALVGLGSAGAAAAAPGIERHQPRLLLEAPSEVVAGQPFAVSILVSDRWGPEGPEVPSAGVERPVTVKLTTGDPAARLPGTVRAGAVRPGRALVEVTLGTPGLWRIDATADGVLPGDTAPIRVLPVAPPTQIFWGDLHAHLHTPGAGHAGALPPDDYERTARQALEFARDVARLDFCAITPHIQTAGGLGGAGGWDALLRAIAAEAQAGRFLPLPGFEWQGDEGDHCVILPGPGAFFAPADFTALGDSVLARGGLLTAHAVYLPTRFEPRHPALAAVEVTRDVQDTHFLGLAALTQGIAPAFLGCSDTHGGAIGSTSLTGLRATALTPDEILRAVREHRTWATNGERIVLDFRVDLGGEVPVVRVNGVATAPVDRIEVYRGPDLVAEARGFGESPEFAFAWEDQDLLRPEALAARVSYHARVVQTSYSRYDASRRDVAIASPLEVRLEARHFEAAHLRRAGLPDRGTGAAVAGLRDAWDALRPAPDRALRADPPPGAPFPGFAPEAIAALRGAVREVGRLASEDPALTELARLAAALPPLADAVGRAAAAGAEAARATSLEEVRAAAARAHGTVTAALAEVPDARAEPLRRAWFAPRLLAGIPAAALERLAQASRASAPVPVLSGDTTVVQHALIPLDPRRLEAAAPWTEAAARLAREMTEAWGYTSPLPVPAADPALRIRVVAEGDPAGGAVTGTRDGTAWSVPLEAARGGWVAVLTREHVPAPGAPPLALTFPEPVRLASVFAEAADGTPFPPLGAVRHVRLERAGTVVTVTLAVGTDSVDVMLHAGDRPVWHGRVGPGDRALVFGSDDLPVEAAVVATWGFAGWRWAGGTLLPGHDAAHADAIGALADGRALVALDGEAVIADPRTGQVQRIPFPQGRRHLPGRELCVVPLPRWTLVRGAAGPAGGWAALLDPASGEWQDAPSGPETGTVAPHPQGGYAWLTGDRLRRRLADGSQVPGETIAARGRLLGFDPAGRPLVRDERGNALRLERGTGAVLGSVTGPVLAAEPGGAVLVFAGLDARHAELAREVRIERVLPNGFRTRHALAVKASPVLDPPIRIAVAPDGALLVLAGRTGWRREPGHDWWGAVVERWEPVWAGRTAAR